MWKTSVIALLAIISLASCTTTAPKVETSKIPIFFQKSDDGPTGEKLVFSVPDGTVYVITDILVSRRLIDQTSRCRAGIFKANNQGDPLTGDLNLAPWIGANTYDNIIMNLTTGARFFPSEQLKVTTGGCNGEGLTYQFIGFSVAQ